MVGPYDVLVLAALAIGWALGRAKGFAWQVSGIATLAIGFLAAAAGSGLVARFFPDSWPAEMRVFAAWTAIYAVASIAIYVATLALQKKLRELELDDLDRRFGGALGAFKAGLALAAVSLVAVAGSEQARVFVQRSASGFVLARVGIVAKPLLPDKIGSALEQSVRKIDPTVTASPAPLTASPPLPAPKPPVARPASPVAPPHPRPRPPVSAPQLDGASPFPRPQAVPTPRAPKPAPSASPSDSMDDDDEGATNRGDPGKAIEPEPEPSAKPEPPDPLAPKPR